MATIEKPSSRKIDGPWLLDKKAFEDLAIVVDKIEVEMDEAYNDYVNQEINLEIEKPNSIYKDKTREEVKDYVLKWNTRLAYDKKEVLIYSKDKKKLIDDSLLNVLKDANIDNIIPKSVLISIEKGRSSFRFEVNEIFDQINYDLRIDNINRQHNISYEIENWLDKYKPSKTVSIWKNFWIGLILLVFNIGLILTALFENNNRENYKQQIILQANNILKDSLSESELKKGVELILKLQSGYVPENYQIEQYKKSNDNVALVQIIGLILIVIIFIKPKTVIGLGRNKGKLRGYKNWILFVTRFLPFTLLIPYLRGLIK